MRHFKGWSIVGIASGVIVGLVVGWALGTKASCGEQCGFDVALFDALGNWVGGVVLAMIGSGYVLYRTRHDRIEALQSAEHETFALARDCVLRFKPLGDKENGFRKLHIEFENKLDERVFSVCLRVIDGIELRSDQQVKVGRTWGYSVHFSDIGLESSYPNEKSAREAINSVGKERIAFAFTLRGFRFNRVGSETVIRLIPIQSVVGA